MSEMLIGTSAKADADVALMRGAGMEWVRQGFAFPFVDRVGGEVSEGYLAARDVARAWVDKGMKVMGVTPLPFGSRFEPDEGGDLHMHWRSRFPEWCGQPGSEEYLQTYQDTCRWLAEDLRGIVPMWQIANELDLGTFAGPLDLAEAADLILRGARGLKEADPSLVIGHNPAGGAGAHFLYGRLYGREDGLLDYCGADGYYGTWQSGGPERWALRVAELRALTGVAVLVNEWGFASRGEALPEGEYPIGTANCQLRKWVHTWGPGHTPEGQAAFVRAAFEAFASRREALLGVFFYRWEDQETCWQCGEADCPIETAWGLVDLQGRPKPSWQAFQDGAALLRG